MSDRFRHGDVRIEDFGAEFLVVCPKCSQRAHVLNRGAKAQPQISLTCVDCGHSQSWKCHRPGVIYSASLEHYEAGTVCIGAAVDWYFHLPLWLQIPCCGETLWAYNAEHLQFLESYVGATLRGRARDQETGWSNQSLASRLPSWMKQAQHRALILRCLAKLKEKLA